MKNSLGTHNTVFIKTEFYKLLYATKLKISHNEYEQNKNNQLKQIFLPFVASKYFLQT